MPLPSPRLSFAVRPRHRKPERVRSSYDPPRGASDEGIAASEVEATEPPRAGRGGRRATARKKLIEAAYTLMARSGIEGVTAAEIIEEAGVGVGSFYNHFDSKQALAQAVFSSRVEEFGSVLEQVVRTLPDAALATCFAYRRLIEEAEKDRLWAAFLLQLEPSTQMLDRLLRKHARAGMQAGIDAGTFIVDDAELAITAVHAIEFAMVRSMLAGTVSHRDAHRSVHLALRLLGVAETTARRLAHLPMSALRREVKAAQTAVA